jgi:hypothetical protein
MVKAIENERTNKKRTVDRTKIPTPKLRTEFRGAELNMSEVSSQKFMKYDWTINGKVELVILGKGEKDGKRRMVGRLRPRGHKSTSKGKLEAQTHVSLIFLIVDTEEEGEVNYTLVLSRYQQHRVTHKSIPADTLRPWIGTAQPTCFCILTHLFS